MSKKYEVADMIAEVEPLLLKAEQSLKSFMDDANKFDETLILIADKIDKLVIIQEVTKNEIFLRIDKMLNGICKNR